MSLFESLGQSYFSANVLLGISFVIFGVVSQATQSRRFKKLYLLRTAQLLILTSVLLGVLSPYLPIRHLSCFYFDATQESKAIQPKISRLKSPDGDSLGPLKIQAAHDGPFSPVSLSSPWLTSANLILSGLLIGGFFFSMGRLVLAIFALMQLLQSSVRLKKLGQIEILVSDQVEVPFATRLRLAAQVVIPIQFLSSKKDLRIAIRHEIQHHRNGDTQWVLGMEILKLVFYANPFIYLWKNKIDELLEFTCDEALMIHGRVSPSDYGDCLIKVAETLVGPARVFLGVTSMAVGFEKGGGMTLLRRRIEKLFIYERFGYHYKSSLGIAAICLLPLVFCTAICAEFSGEKPVASLAKSLNVDSTIQSLTNLALTQGSQKSTATNAYAVVSNANTGQVLAISYFDGTRQRSVSSEAAKAVVSGKTIQPNSLMKPILTAYALDRDQIKIEEKLKAENGYYRVGNQIYRDSQRFSSLTPAEVIIYSSNIGGIKVAEKLGAEGLTKAMVAFGIGKAVSSSSQILYSTGQIPTLPNPESIADFAMGQNTTFSPLEIVQAYGAIVNGGMLAGRQIISPNTSKQMRAALEKAVSEGTGTNAQLPLYTTGGKTGTGFAYVGESQEYIKKYGYAHFVGFAPVSNPQVVIYVVVEGPKDSGHGNTHAAPIFGKIAESVLGYLKVAPDRVSSDHIPKDV